MLAIRKSVTLLGLVAALLACGVRASAQSVITLAQLSLQACGGRLSRSAVRRIQFFQPFGQPNLDERLPLMVANINNFYASLSFPSCNCPRIFFRVENAPKTTMPPMKRYTQTGMSRPTTIRYR